MYKERKKETTKITGPFYFVVLDEHTYVVYFKNCFFYSFET